MAWGLEPGLTSQCLCPVVFCHLHHPDGKPPNPHFTHGESKGQRERESLSKVTLEPGLEPGPVTPGAGRSQPGLVEEREREGIGLGGGVQLSTAAPGALELSAW